MWLVTNSKKFWTKIGSDLTWESNSTKPLGVTIDNQIKFDDHVSLLCATPNRRLPAIASMTQNRTLIKAFFKSQFI